MTVANEVSNATLRQVKHMPARSVKARLLDRGLTIAGFARSIQRSRPLVSLVIRRRTTSDYVWREIARVLNEGKR